MYRCANVHTLTPAFGCTSYSKWCRNCKWCRNGVNIFVKFRFQLTHTFTPLQTLWTALVTVCTTYFYH